MRQTFQCLECGGTLRMCSLFEREGVECWHCDTCTAKVTADRAGELSILGSAVRPLEQALDKLRATQTRHGMQNLERELKFILSKMDQSRQGVAEVLRRIGAPIVQEVPKKKSYLENLVHQLNESDGRLHLEGE